MRVQALLQMPMAPMLRMVTDVKPGDPKDTTPLTYETTVAYGVCAPMYDTSARTRVGARLRATRLTPCTWAGVLIQMRPVPEPPTPELTPGPPIGPEPDQVVRSRYAPPVPARLRVQLAERRTLPCVAQKPKPYPKFAGMRGDSAHYTYQYDWDFSEKKGAGLNAVVSADEQTWVDTPNGFLYARRRPEAVDLTMSPWWNMKVSALCVAAVRSHTTAQRVRPLYDKEVSQRATQCQRATGLG